ncbi:hypothetical protein CASFOL_031402 [Castilleja foliolosa]|uniref:Pentatricopeptide repeat-containing protein n=1 Tax=Castilleja foliolosa TaxID=1961234 RepID=A0ABD3C565_9LAMI
MQFHTCVGSSQLTLRSPCKLQALFLGFTPHNPLPLNNFHKKTKTRHAQNKPPSKDGVFLGFKLQCHSKIAALSNKNMNNKWKKKKKYGGILPSVLRALESDKDLEKTLESYHGKLNPKEQTVILKEQSKWDKVLRVFEWFKSQEDYIPNVIHYNVVLRSLGKAKKWDELRLCWIEMAKKSILPSNNTYSMLVDVYGKAGLVKESLLWIKHMKLRGIFPDEVTMSTVVKVLKDAGEYDRADKFYKDWSVGKIELDDLDFGDDQSVISLKQFLLSELFRTGGRSNSSKNDIETSVQKPRLTATYNTLIDLYGKAGRLNDAAGIFSEMLKAGVDLDIFTFNTMIFICGSEGHLSEAEALLNKMEERGVFPDTKTYNIFISLYANVGNIDSVLECYRKIKELGLFPDNVTHRAIIKILTERNMVREVEDVIREIENLDRRIDDSSIPLLVKMYVGAGLCDRAKGLIEKCKSCNGFSSRTYAAIMDVYAENGLCSEAEGLFYGKCEQKDVLEYNVMIKAYGKAGLYDKAVSLFRGMRNQGTWPDECTYNSLIQMLAGGDLVEQAEKARVFLAEMQESGFKPNCSTFSAVISSFAKKNKLLEAVDVYEEMLRTDVEPNEVVYGSLIDGFAENGDFEEADHYFRAMQGSGISANKIILTSMIKVYGKIKSVEGAKILYEKMKKFDGGPDIVASNSMLNLYGELNLLSEARSIFDHLIEIKLADGVTYATMIEVYKNMGMQQMAIEVAKEMKKSGLVTDCVTYNKVMACYATNGQLIDCGELLHEMVVDKKLLPDIGTFRVLFTVLKKGGVPSEAVRQLESSYEEKKPFAKQAIITSVFSVVGLHKYALESCGVFAKKGVGFNSSAYNAAIRAYTAYGKTEEALKMFMRMQDEGIKPDVVTLISLVSCYGKAGMVEGIKRIHSQLKYGDIEFNESLYEAVMQAYKNVNRNDLAELVSQEMRFVSDGQQFTDSETEDYDEQ